MDSVFYAWGMKTWNSFKDHDVYINNFFKNESYFKEKLNQSGLCSERKNPKIKNLHIFVILWKKSWNLKCKFKYGFSIVLCEKKSYFLISCRKRYSETLNTFHASLWDGIEGRLSSNKDDSVSLLLPILKETWSGKFSHLLQSLQISLPKKTVLLHFLCAFRSHLVQ